MHHLFPGEIIRGLTVSPDLSLLAIVTTSRDIYEDRQYQPINKVFLNVLQAKDCKLLRRLILPFPDIKPVWRAPLLAPNNKYLDNELFKDQLASSMAISPDNTKLALAYGVYKSSDGIAFGLFLSLTVDDLQPCAEMCIEVVFCRGLRKISFGPPWLLSPARCDSVPTRASYLQHRNAYGNGIFPDYIKFTNAHCQGSRDPSMTKSVDRLFGISKKQL